MNFIIHCFPVVEPAYINAVILSDPWEHIGFFRVFETGDTARALTGHLFHKIHGRLFTVAGKNADPFGVGLVFHLGVRVPEYRIGTLKHRGAFDDLFAVVFLINIFQLPGTESADHGFLHGIFKRLYGVITTTGSAVNAIHQIGGVVVVANRFEIDLYRVGVQFSDDLTHRFAQNVEFTPVLQLALA